MNERLFCILARMSWSRGCRFRIWVLLFVMGVLLSNGCVAREGSSTEVVARERSVCEHGLVRWSEAFLGLVEGQQRTLCSLAVSTAMHDRLDARAVAGIEGGTPRVSIGMYDRKGTVLWSASAEVADLRRMPSTSLIESFRPQGAAANQIAYDLTSVCGAGCQEPLGVVGEAGDGTVGVLLRPAGAAIVPVGNAVVALSSPAGSLLGSATRYAWESDGYAGDETSARDVAHWADGAGTLAERVVEADLCSGILNPRTAERIAASLPQGERLDLCVLPVTSPDGPVRAVWRVQWEGPELISVIEVEAEGVRSPLWRWQERMRWDGNAACCTFATLTTFVPPGDTRGQVMLFSRYCGVSCGASAVSIVQPVRVSAREVLNRHLSAGSVVLPLGRGLVVSDVSRDATAEVRETWYRYDWNDRGYVLTDEVVRGRSVSDG